MSTGLNFVRPTLEAVQLEILLTATHTSRTMAAAASKSPKMPKGNPRKRAMRAWDDGLDSLDQAATTYVKKTAKVFNQFSEEKAEDSVASTSQAVDMSIEDGLSHIDQQLERLARLERELHNARVGLQVRRRATLFRP